MAVGIDKIAEALFEKIRSRFDEVSVGDETATATQDPAKARFFNFDYSSKDGTNFGNVSVSLVDADSLKIFFGKNLSSDLTPEQKVEWYDFLRDIRMFAKRNMLTFDTRDISRNNLTIKDIKQQAKADGTYTAGEVNMHESKMYGNKKTSFEPIAPGVRLRIRHNGIINADIQGARTRKIDSVFVETDEGERIKCPTNNLAGCRALARHVAENGNMNDDFGKHITEMVIEMSKIKQFVRASKNKVYEDDEANEIAEAAKARFSELRKTIHSLGGPRGAKAYKESWSPSTTNAEEVGDIDSIKGKFMTKKYDDRLTDGLPYAARAYSKTKTVVETQLDEFAAWADDLTEGTWAVPDTYESMQKLQELMSERLEAGVDGNNATSALYDLVGDDTLFDMIYDASKGSPEMDVRPVVMNWLEHNMPDAATKIKANMMASLDDKGGEEDTTNDNDMGDEEDTTNDNDMGEREYPQYQAPEERQPGNESGDPLAVMRRLAGINK